MRGFCHDSATSWVFFFMGIAATVAMRVIEPFNSINPLYGRISWFVGVTGFLLFFIYKYRILHGRAKVIRETGLAEKLANASRLSSREYILLSEIVCSQDNWKERANFLIIFVLSAAALLFALVVEFF